MSGSILIIGAGGHATSVANVALAIGMRVSGFVDDLKAGKELLGIPVISMHQCEKRQEIVNLAIAIGDNAARERVTSEYKSKFPSVNFPPLIHHSAVIGVNSKVGAGAVIMPMANIGPNSSVGEFCVVNTASSIDHDCQMYPFSSLAPGVVAGGNVSIGTRSAISIGTIVKHGIEIGQDAVVGAHSYVNKAVENNVVAYGSPCRYVRSRSIGDTYLS